MSDELIENYVWHSAGFGFFEDGIYIVDFGFEAKVVDWTETDQSPDAYDSS